MVCDNLQHGIVFSKTNPELNETITCTSTINNTGATTETFHIVFSEQGGDPFYTSPSQTIAAGASKVVTTSFEATRVGQIIICADLVCDSVIPGGLAPVANFTADKTSGVYSEGQEFLAVQFTDLSTNNPTSWVWEFGEEQSGDLPENHMQNPAWRYWGFQSYTVTLTVSNAYGSDTRTKTNFITFSDGGQIIPEAPVADFTASPTNGVAPLAVHFTNASVGAEPMTYEWDFQNDGTVDNTTTNPYIAYPNAGTYSVKLTATNAHGTDSVVKTGIITVTAGGGGTAPVANFSLTPTSGSAPLTVKFTDQSTGSPTSYQWSFKNDGVINSTVASPTYTYASNGTYSVKLTVTNNSGSNSIIKNGAVIVSTPTSAPVAAFTATPVLGSTPLTVIFTNTSTGNPTGFSWSFGDGGTSSAQNPSHTYAAAGTYSVALTVTNSVGSNSITKASLITVSPYVPPVSTGFGCPSTVPYKGVEYAIGGSYQFTANGKQYGGGTQYPAYTAGVAGGTYNGSTITTKDQLVAACSAARSPAVIYISPSANIDMGSTIDIPVYPGVTIASNRGVGGSRGGRIYSKTPVYGAKPIFRIPSSSNNVRFTGLVLEGETMAQGAGSESMEPTYKMGIWVDGASGFECDNCELYGFAYADVYLAGCPTGSGAPWIHHCFIHGSWNNNEGYGCNVGKSGDMLVEANVFDRNRHDITSDGDLGDRYTVRYNIITGDPFLTTGRAHFDSHGGNSDVGRPTSGIEYQIYNNTFLPGSTQLCIHQRGKPQVAMRVHHNMFAGDSAESGHGGLPVCQTADNTSGNMDVHDNYWNKNGVSIPLVSSQFYAGASGVLVTR
jgi:PKD repeat protein